MPQRGAPPARSAAGQRQLAAQIPDLPPEAIVPRGRAGTIELDLRPVELDLQPAGPPAPPEKGFFGGLREMFLPEDFQVSDILTGPAFALRHPVEAAKLVVPPMFEAQRRVGGEAMRAVREGRPSEAVGYGLATAIPVLGPVAAEIGERAGRGELARAAGNITGLLGPGMLSRAVAPRPSAAAISRNTLPASAQGRVRTLPSQRGSARLGALEPLVERSMGGIQKFEQFRREQQADIGRWADQIVEDISGFSGDAEAIGAQVESSLNAVKAQMRRRSSAIYEAIDEAVTPEIRRVPRVTEEPSAIVGPRGEALTTQRRRLVPEQVGGVMPETRTIRAEAAKLLRKMREVKSIPSQELATITNQLETLVKLPKRTTFYDFQQSRSILLEVTRRFDDPVSGRRAGISRLLAGQMDQAMEKALRDAGRTDLLDDLRAANAITKDLHETFNESVIHRILDAAPEKAHHFLLSRSTPLADLRTIHSVIGEQPWQAMKAQIARDLLDKATAGELSQWQQLVQHVPEAVGAASEAMLGGGEGSAIGALVGSRATAALMGARMKGGAMGLMNQLERIGYDRLRAIYSNQELRNIEAVAQTAEKAGVRGQSWFAQALNAHMIYKGGRGLMRTVAGDVGGLTDIAQAGGFYALSNVVARLLLTQPGSNAISRFIRALDTGHPEAINRTSRALVVLMSQEERREREQAAAPGAAPLPQLPQ